MVAVQLQSQRDLLEAHESHRISALQRTGARIVGIVRWDIQWFPYQFRGLNATPKEMMRVVYPHMDEIDRPTKTNWPTRLDLSLWPKRVPKSNVAYIMRSFAAMEAADRFELGALAF